MTSVAPKVQRVWATCGADAGGIGDGGGAEAGGGAAGARGASAFAGRFVGRLRGPLWPAFLREVVRFSATRPSFGAGASFLSSDDKR
jgi:hypothetical protein